MTVWSSSNGTTDTAPGWCTRTRSNSVPSGATNVPTAVEITWPRWISRSLTLPNPVTKSGQADGRYEDLVAQKQMRIPALGPRERGSDELAEQRCRSIGPALELRMGLRADPERVPFELDELDQPTVGRDARAAQPGGLELR